MGEGARWHQGRGIRAAWEEGWPGSPALPAVTDKEQRLDLGSREGDGG